MTQQENDANADKLSIQKIIFFVNDSVSIRQEATFCVERWRERNVFCTERESFGFSGKCFTGRRCSLLTDKREPERTAVPAGHDSPSGAFKLQTGLQSKCRVFGAARSPLLSRRGRRRVAAPYVCFVPWTALASCRPLPQQLLPVSAAGRGRRRCKLRAARP